MNKGVAALCMAAMVVLLAAEAEAVTCSVLELRPCLNAITGGENPSAECCSKLKEQQPCFCDYVKNPALRPYIDSPNARKVANICAVTIPSCS